MNLEALYHGPKNNWAYAYDADTVHLRFRTKRDDVDRVFAVTGDKYDWDRTACTVPMIRIAADGLFDYWEAAVEPKYRRMNFGFKLQAGEETVWMVESGISREEPCPPVGYYQYPYLHEKDLFLPPSWAKEAVFYQIFTERFAKGDAERDPEGVEAWGGKPTRENFFGGDLQGVMDKLDYLQELGINAIYFTPVFEAPSNHKYDTVDYYRIDPHFGDVELMKALVRECHRRNIRVVLDAVFNHASEQFPPFRDVVAKGEYSQFRDWFHVREFPLTVRDGIPTYDTFGFFPDMPKFNTANPEVKRYLLNVAVHWIKELDIDGWRLDVADEIDHEFWRDFRRIVKEAKPDAYIIGEVWNDSIMWLLGDQFDSVMNYPFSSKVLEFFSAGEIDGYRFANSLGSLLMRYPQQANEVVFNLLCSHDTPRVLTLCGGDKRRLKLCVVFLLTYMGTPCIFYGDEIGLSGESDPDCRKCMIWEEEEQDRELFDFYKLLIGLRRKHEALREGRFRFLHAAEGDARILYERLDDSDHFTIWMNNAEEETELSHPFGEGGWRDALSGEEVPVKDGEISVRLEPLGYRILCRSPS